MSMIAASLQIRAIGAKTANRIQNGWMKWLIMRGDNPFLRPAEMVARIASAVRVSASAVCIEVYTEMGWIQFQASAGPFTRGEPASTPTQALDNLLSAVLEAQASAAIEAELFG